MTDGLRVQQLTKHFDSAAGELTILRDAELSMSTGDSVVITGPSGSGKSTLLYIVGMLDQPSSGTVSLNGVDFSSLSSADQAQFRNEQIGFVFQDHHLLPQCSVLENVLLPTLAGFTDRSDAVDRAKALLDRVGLSDRIQHFPAILSGGERQRVAVCRALINQPVLLLADEPTGNLDPVTAESVGSLLLEVSNEQQTMLVCVTHSMELANRFPVHYELSQGKLVEVSNKLDHSAEANA
ncbi:Lipoprotein-releasing system ATP-binding protein LolD [Thalassoglobus neptunius]|uniref:Lipoprotein-releasing system ATP-binding protein LolD n=1 Tax=Thalassoglobus neptunius TaxID=1938619 RepID=A0A5C5X5B4_9PLAN|nr:ABC transporter ATP-binding protein [Thalassoglobus neptunius]TWT57938.1 Lipoprotein-releasing system ATP-binding protein LolD [Thalassoglobus neptunius]